jgi:RND family efflux transporter MFP subunit
VFSHFYVIINFLSNRSMNYKLKYLIIALTLITGSCGQIHDDHDHDNTTEHNHEMEGDKNPDQHNHGDVKLHLIAYGLNYELYAEADPFVVGHDNSILTHFTNLADFSPLSKGVVSMSLSVNGSTIQQTLDQPLREGIYLFEINPQKEGVGELIFKINTSAGISTITVSDIYVFSDIHDAIHDAEEKEITADGIIFTKEQSWKVDFATEEVKAEAIGNVIKTAARIEAAQGDEVLISAKTNGIVGISADHVLEGRSVSTGQQLFSVSGNGLANNNSAVRYTEAKNNFEKAEADYNRAKALASDNIVTQRELLDAKNRFENAKVIFENLDKNFNTQGQKIESPMNGFIKQLYVQNGQYVETGQPIVLVAQNKTLLLNADVPQKYAKVLGTLFDANIRTLHNNKSYTFKQLNGEIISYGKSTNDHNYLIPVSLKIDNTGDFIPGSFVEVYLKTISQNQAITVPNTALIEEQGNYSVFIQITPEAFEKRNIQIGVTDGIRIEIIEGVNPGERVVSKGAMLIKLSQASGTLDAHSGHVH